MGPEGHRRRAQRRRMSGQGADPRRSGRVQHERRRKPRRPHLRRRRLTRLSSPTTVVLRGRTAPGQIRKTITLDPRDGEEADES